MKLFLDACIIIYWVESSESYYKKLTEKLQSLKVIHKSLSFSASHLSLLECRVKPMHDRNEELLSRYKQFFYASDLTLVPLSLEVIEKALELRALYKLRTPDALQAACALSINDEVLFLTNDKKFKKIPNLNVQIT